MKKEMLFDRINDLSRDEKIRSLVDKRLEEFSGFSDQPGPAWFSELCFCLLTANAKSRTALAIQQELGHDGFLNHEPEEITQIIKKNKHRFHNIKTSYIIAAREHSLIKDTIRPLAEKSQEEAREWLVKNITGYGYKEASHFLRNVGFFDLAILDRHILNLMVEYGFLREKPQSLNRTRYRVIEDVFRKMAEKMNMSCAELDFYMWYIKAGGILK
ncbi:MAG: N-glycosylase/DNA lyase [Nanoarchaeota archaeon]